MPDKAKPPGKAKSKQPDLALDVSTKSEVDTFLGQVRAMTPHAATQSRGRLIFAMDATMSRQPTWDLALGLQAGMFEVVKELGGLDVQLVYFRGFDECRASKWASDPESLARMMSQVQCRGGHTQIGRVLTHTRKETQQQRVGALVYVGDCVEEGIDDLSALAGELGLLGVPAFFFQEGYNAQAETAFREMAKLTRGAYCRFDAGSGEELRALLSAVAVYAAGGRPALADLSQQAGGNIRALLEQLS